MTKDEPTDRPDPVVVKARTTGVFDRASSTYDRTGVEFFSVWGRRLVEVSGIGAGDAVLDVGCGTGAVLVPAAQAVGPGGSATGVDLAEGMVRQCTEQLAELGIRNAVVTLGDAEDPDVTDGSFDAVLAGLVIFFLPDPAAALRAHHRALRPGGTIALSTFGPEDPRFGPVFAAIAAHIPSDGSEPSGPSRREPGPFGTDEGVEAMLHAAGFTGIAHLNEARDVHFRDGQQWIDWSWSHGARALWESVPAEARDAAHADALGALAELSAPDGGLDQRWALRYSTARRPA